MLVITRGYILLNPIKIPLNHHFPMVFLWVTLGTDEGFCWSWCIWCILTPALPDATPRSSHPPTQWQTSISSGAKVSLLFRRQTYIDSEVSQATVIYLNGIFYFSYIYIWVTIYYYIKGFFTQRFHSIVKNQTQGSTGPSERVPLEFIWASGIVLRCTAHHVLSTSLCWPVFLANVPGLIQFLTSILMP